MTDLEERIADTFRHQAPVFVRPMPKSTVARVRLRKVVTSVASLTLVAALTFGTIGIMRIERESSRPADRQTVGPLPGILPSPQGEADGVDDATAAPATGSTASEDTSAHGTNSTVPYTDQVVGQEAYLLTQKHVVAFGHVSDIEWSLAAYDTRSYSGEGFHFLGGQCGDLMLGDQGEYGGISFCLHTDETTPDAAFGMAGFGNGSDQNVGSIIGYAGLVGSRVSTVELRLSDGDRTELRLYEALSSIDARYFVLFVEPGTRGQIVALGPEGTELGAGTLCVFQAPSDPWNVGCGHGLEAVSSVVTSSGP